MSKKAKLIMLIALFAIVCNANSKEQLKKEFVNPPTENSIIPFWFLNGDLNEIELTRQMEDFVNHHVYGVVLHPRIGLSREVGYLTPRWFELIGHICKEARRLGMQIILYDEGMYPSGSAMGKVVAANKDYASQGLKMVAQKTDSDGRYSFEIAEDERVVAVLSAVDIDENTIKAGSIKSLGKELSGAVKKGTTVYLLKQIPSGGLIRGVYFGEDTDNLPFDNPPAAGDLLNPEATDKFIELTHDAYYNAVREYFGKEIIGMFTDEPSIMGKSSKKGLKPWTWGYETFLSSYSKTLSTENLLLLYKESSDGSQIKVRSEFKLAEAEKLNESFYEPLSEWCENHNIALTGHPHGANEITPQKFFQIPGQDIVWRSVVPGKTALESEQSMNAKSASSAARNWGRRLVLNECFGAYGMQFKADEMKWLSDWLLVRGINRLSPHAFYYSIEGPRFYERPPDVGPNNLWWDHYQLFADYIARLSWVNVDNEQVCDIAIYSEYNNYGQLSSKVLFQNQIDFNYIDETIRDATDFNNKSTFENSKVKIGPQDYSTIIIDGLSVISNNGLDFLKKCSDRGIHIILHSETDISELKNKRISYELCTTEDEFEAYVLKTVERDLIPSSKQEGLRGAHVVKGGIDFYLCVNEVEDEIACDLSLPVVGKAEYWNAEDGSISDCPVYYEDGTRITVPLKLLPGQSIVIAVDRKIKPVISPRKVEVELEYVIDGNWIVLTPKRIERLDGPTYWTDFEEYRNYSGMMLYTIKFNVDKNLLEKELILDLGDVKDFATVYLNQEKLGTRLWKPFLFKVLPGMLNEGENTLDIEVTNSLANGFGDTWLPSGLNKDIKIIEKK